MIPDLISDGKNRAAQALENWLVRDGDWNDALAALIARTGASTLMINRWLSGEVKPSAHTIEAIGRLTDGAVTGAMWDEMVLPTVIGIDPDDLRGEASAMFNINDAIPATVAPVPTPALLCEISGPLGTMPSGAPFRVITDPVAPGLFVLAGPGVALVLDESLGWAMREALTMGLQDIRAEARPIAAAAGRTIG